MRQSIEFGASLISFELAFVPRKTLGITVLPNKEVIVKAPVGATLESVQKKVRKRASWILRQQNYFDQFLPRPTPKQYVSGESHLYMGRQYLLEVKIGQPESVKYAGAHITVIAKKRDRVENLLSEWYRIHAERKFAEIARPIIEDFQKYGVKPHGIFMKHMPTSWGKYTSDGKIFLNPELIKAPRGCIEYVMIHELCHLVHPNHSQKFYQLLSKEMPEWQKWKERLEVFLS